MNWRRFITGYQNAPVNWQRTNDSAVLLYRRRRSGQEPAELPPPLLLHYSAIPPRAAEPSVAPGPVDSSDDGLPLDSSDEAAAQGRHELANLATVPVAVISSALPAEVPVLIPIQVDAIAAADEPKARAEDLVDEDCRTIFNDPLLGDELTPPPDVTVRGRTWSGPAPDAHSALGCAAFIGPPEVIEEGKDNEDFSFAVSHFDVNGAAWLLCGVADGTSNGCWQRRGAQLACAGFLSVVKEFLSSVDDVAELCGSRMAELFAPRFTAHLRHQLAEDMKRIVHERAVPPNFRKNPALYFDYFFDSEDSAEQRLLLWFQTTLLAAALGPKGGIALTIGDGLVRWDRRQTGPWQSQWIEPSAVASARLQLGTGRVVSTEIEESLVRSSLHRLPAAGAHEMRILMASDGVGNSVQHSLESTWFDSTGECARYLLHLAANLPDTLQPDNMSIAFAGRRLAP